MSSAAKIIGKVKRSVEKVAYGNALYHKFLTAGDHPERLTFTPPDLWPGDAQAGMALMATQRSMFPSESTPDTLHDNATENIVVNARASASTLRNLRAIGTEAARSFAVHLISNGMDHCAAWNDTAWEPSALGARITAWISFYDFYADAAPEGFSVALAENLCRQWKHLLRTVPGAPEGIAGLNIIRGLICGSLNFSSDQAEMERTLGLACDLLRRQLVNELLPDGLHRSRNPSVHLRVLQYLLELRAIFKLAGLPFPEEATMAISAMTPVLKFFRHGDGALALFHGGREESSLMIDATLTMAEVRGRMPRRLTQSGVERITAGRSWLMADGGTPPLGGHAGLLSFEFGQGKERIIVNCGGYEDDARAAASHNNAWRSAMAATAAHSTLTLHDTNAAEVTPKGGVRYAVPCTANCFEHEGQQGIEMRHEGYVAPFGMLHQRSLVLSTDGDVVRGRDTLTATRNSAYNQDFALRWHLHPSVQVALSQNGQTALLRTASGAGWRLRVEGHGLALEPSIYCGHGAPRRTMQLKATGMTQATETTIDWSLTREKK